MTPDVANVYAALIASASALLGGFLGSLGTYFIQKNAIRNETIEHAKRTLISDEIKALQQFSVLIDFVEANAPHIKDGFKFFDQLWEIVHECNRNIGCLPNELRNDAREIIITVYRGAGDGTVILNNDHLLNIRSRILSEIDTLKYEGVSHS